MITIIDPDSPYHLHKNSFKIFLAGGITGCPDWQKELIDLLNSNRNIGGKSIVLFNPRRENFPIHDPSAAEFQVEWEYERLHEADLISFWFPKETLCPIVLYELGFWNAKQSKPLVIGCDPGYQRLQDVKIQSSLAGYEDGVCSSIKELGAMIEDSIHSCIWDLG